MTGRTPMSYTLSEAAAACGVNKSTVLRAVKRGRISGTKDEFGHGMSRQWSCTGFFRPWQLPRQAPMRCLAMRPLMPRPMPWLPSSAPSLPTCGRTVTSGESRRSGLPYRQRCVPRHRSLAAPSYRRRRKCRASAAPGAGCGRQGEGQGPRSGRATRPAPNRHLEEIATSRARRRPHPFALAAKLPRWRGAHHLGAQALASPSYGVDVVALALAVVLAAAIALLVSQIMPHLADLMMPPALGGTR